MTTEKHDPWALLREAREELSVLASYVGHPDTVWPNVGLKTTAKCHKIMRDRIDAALAEHDAEERVDSATQVVEPVAPSALPEVESDGFWREETYRNNVHKCAVLIQRNGVANWYWSVGRTFDAANVGRGFAATLDEAQRAALAAARGLR